MMGPCPEYKILYRVFVMLLIYQEKERKNIVEASILD